MNKFNVLALVLIAGISIRSVTASAENFVVEGGKNGVNKALNTNNKFSKIDGTPRMSLWDFSANDADQIFDISQGGLGGKLLKHRSTNKCLNAHYVVNGGAINVSTCNPNDLDQNFNINDVGGGYFQIQRTRTKHCVDSPTRDNGGKIHLWDCIPSNSNQKWKTSTTTVTPPRSGYYTGLGSLSNDKWDEYTGDNTRFDPPLWAGEVDERSKTPSEIAQIYTDLTTTIFGQRRRMTAGYLYDVSYFNGQGKKWHAAIDIDAPNGTPVKAVIGGTTWNIQNTSGNYFMAVKGDDGKLWIYGHLGTLNVASGTRIEAGNVVGKTGSLNHLHLEVQNNANKYEQTAGAHSNQQFVKDVTFSPLQAFWQVKNR